MSEAVRHHYEEFPYPSYPLAASVRRCDTYALNLEALWIRFHGKLPPPGVKHILIAGCGSFSPYPFAVANPRIPITAIDLSRRSLQRARLHCLLHGRSNVTFLVGDICDREVMTGRFGLIDAYGVLHHLDDPLEGLKSLAERLAAGGILRIMLYSRYARREEESIRRVVRILKIKNIRSLKRLLARAKPGSRLYRFVKNSSETTSASGLADALLHPCVHTFRIDECLELIAKAGLKPLLFAHAKALENVDAEVKRIRLLEAKRQSPGNFVVYLARASDWRHLDINSSVVMLNPCLRDRVGFFGGLGSLQVLPRLGHRNPPVGRRERKFLRRFIKPVPWKALSCADQITANIYLKSLFLLKYQP
jgi:SAM-dependent methyltransferase